jgi:micrococcal nuclease
MEHKKIIGISIFVIGLFIVIGYSAFTGYLIKTQKSERIIATVADVIDGDTLELTTGERVRLLGTNAPEKGEYYYNESKNKLKQLVEGKNVSLEKDVIDKDRYNRLLRYVFLDNTFVNLELVKEGYSTVYIIPPNIKYSKEFLEAENEAKKNEIGVWKTSAYKECIEIVNFHYNAKGNDNENLNDEYVIFKNVCDFSIDMNNWEIKDEATNIYRFSEFSLLPHATVTLYSGSGIDSVTELYWNSRRAIWNNVGDTLYLRNSNGNLVLSQSYGK